MTLQWCAITQIYLTALHEVKETSMKDIGNVRRGRAQFKVQQRCTVGFPYNTQTCGISTANYLFNIIGNKKRIKNKVYRTSKKYRKEKTFTKSQKRHINDSHSWSSTAITKNTQITTSPHPNLNLSLIIYNHII